MRTPRTEPRGARPKDLVGAVIVITGASSGIGRATARAFASRGARLVLAARRQPALDQAAIECRALGGEAVAVTADVAEIEDVERLANTAFERFGQIDVWINCAAVLQYGRFEETPAAVLDRLIRTNVLGQFHGSQVALRRFRATGRGTLINVGSVLGLVGHAYTAAYAASKFAVLGLNSSLRQELRDAPEIHVCELLPATIDTPIYRRAANFTGRDVGPMRPIYSPQLAAAKIVGLARRPRARAYVGGMARGVALAHLFAPAAVELGARIVARRVEIHRGPAAATSGNVLEPVEDAYAVDGGWRTTPRHRGPRSPVPLALAAVGGLGAIVIALWSRRSPRPRPLR